MQRQILRKHPTYPENVDKHFKLVPHIPGFNKNIYQSKFSNF